jgi:hypothetical protein
MVINAHNPLLWNLMYPPLGEPDGSFVSHARVGKIAQDLSTDAAGPTPPLTTTPPGAGAHRVPTTSHPGRDGHLNRSVQKGNRRWSSLRCVRTGRWPSHGPTGEKDSHECREPAADGPRLNHLSAATENCPVTAM